MCEDGLVKAYIRGRKLHGKTVKLPEGYCGSVVEKGGTRTVVPEADGVQGDDAEAEELSEAIEIAPLSSIAKFDEFVIWGHESTADSGDPYLRSIEEWVSFSEQVRLQISYGSSYLYSLAALVFHT